MSLAIGVESSDNLGVPLYTNATDYVMHDADIEQKDYSKQIENYINSARNTYYLYKLLVMYKFIRFV